MLRPALNLAVWLILPSLCCAATHAEIAADVSCVMASLPACTAPVVPAVLTTTTDLPEGLPDDAVLLPREKPAKSVANGWACEGGVCRRVQATIEAAPQRPVYSSSQTYYQPTVYHRRRLLLWRR